MYLPFMLLTWHCEPSAHRLRMGPATQTLHKPTNWATLCKLWICCLHALIAAVTPASLAQHALVLPLGCSRSQVPLRCSLWFSIPCGTNSIVMVRARTSKPIGLAPKPLLRNVDQCLGHVCCNAGQTLHHCQIIARRCYDFKQWEDTCGTK